MTLFKKTQYNVWCAYAMNTQDRRRRRRKQFIEAISCWSIKLLMTQYISRAINEARYNQSALLVIIKFNDCLLASNMELLDTFWWWCLCLSTEMGKILAFYLEIFITKGYSSSSRGIKILSRIFICSSTRSWSLFLTWVNLNNINKADLFIYLLIMANDHIKSEA